jgi:hypothetical protein
MIWEWYTNDAGARQEEWRWKGPGNEAAWKRRRGAESLTTWQQSAQPLVPPQATPAKTPHWL